MGTKELVDAVVQRKYPTTSTNLQAMIETRVGELARKGILKRGAGKRILMGKSATTEMEAPAIPTSKMPLTTKAGKNQKRKSLKVIITEVLAKSDRPVTSDELLKRVLQSGYQTKSKNFMNVIWVGIGDMENVERVADGYRLKKGKTTVNKK
jgi:hypothetical protein